MEKATYLKNTVWVLLVCFVASLACVASLLFASLFATLTDVARCFVDSFVFVVRHAALQYYYYSTYQKSYARNR